MWVMFWCYEVTAALRVRVLKSLSCIRLKKRKALVMARSQAKVRIGDLCTAISFQKNCRAQHIASTQNCARRHGLKNVQALRDLVEDLHDILSRLSPFPVLTRSLVVSFRPLTYFCCFMPTLRQLAVSRLWRRLTRIKLQLLRTQGMTLELCKSVSLYRHRKSLIRAWCHTAKAISTSMPASELESDCE